MEGTGTDDQLMQERGEPVQGKRSRITFEESENPKVIESARETRRNLSRRTREKDLGLDAMGDDVIEQHTFKKGLSRLHICASLECLHLLFPNLFCQVSYLYLFLVGYDSDDDEESHGAQMSSLDTDAQRDKNGAHDSDNEDSPRVVRKLTHVHGEESTTIAWEGDVEITGFNLEDERDEGYYDEEGNFIWKRDARTSSTRIDRKKGRIDVDGVESDDSDVGKDAWLESLDEMNPLARRSMEEKAKSTSASDNFRKAEEIEYTNIQKARHLWLLKEIMEDGETITTTLRRLVGDKKQRGRSRSSVSDSASTDDSNRSRFNAVTEGATELMNSGMTEIYQLTRRQIQAEYKELLEDEDLDERDVLEDIDEAYLKPTSASTASSRPPSTQLQLPISYLPVDKMWKYKWDIDSMEEFGPFPSSHLNAWIAAGFFQMKEPFVREDMTAQDSEDDIFGEEDETTDTKERDNAPKPEWKRLSTFATVRY